MRALAKALGSVGIIGAAVLMISNADARPRFDHSYDSYAPQFDRSYDAYDSVGPARSSIPNDAGGRAYRYGAGGLDSSSDFQLQGR
jgi:hypothetical protein